MNSLFKKLSKGRYPPLPEHFSMELANIIDSMLRVNPKDRMTIQSLSKELKNIMD
jgi:serine/threonine protein kinase